MEDKQNESMFGGLPFERTQGHEHFISSKPKKVLRRRRRSRKSRKGFGSI